MANAGVSEVVQRAAVEAARSSSGASIWNPSSDPLVPPICSSSGSSETGSTVSHGSEAPYRTTATGRFLRDDRWRHLLGWRIVNVNVKPCLGPVVADDHRVGRVGIVGVRPLHVRCEGSTSGMAATAEPWRGPRPGWSGLGGPLTGAGAGAGASRKTS